MRVGRRMLVLSDESWRRHGSCASSNIELEWFFPGPSDQNRSALARAVCEDCPVRQPCLEDAMLWPNLQGIRAGTNQRDRTLLRSERREQQRAAS